MPGLMSMLQEFVSRSYLFQLLTYFAIVHTPQPLEVVAPFFKQINTFLEKLITWPRDVGKAIWTCQTSFPSPT
jgi:hypothetical protein